MMSSTDPGAEAAGRLASAHDTVPPDPLSATPAEVVVWGDTTDARLWVKPSVRTDIAILDSDPTWPDEYEQLTARIRVALGQRVLGLQHIGSTSVPGLPAKPVIDIDLVVADPADEDDYRGSLEAIGFDLVIREPGWYEHRAFRHQEPDGTQRAPLCNLHVFGPRCPEVARHRLFRDWLREHAADRRLYTEAKRSAAHEANAAGETTAGYNARKEAVVRDIYARIFAAAGWV